MYKIKSIFTNNRWVYWISQILFLVLIYTLLHTWKIKELVHGKAPELRYEFLNNQTQTAIIPINEPVLVHFWASWCPVCKLEQSTIESLSKDYQVITIASWSESTQVLKDFITEHNIKAPVINDNNGEIALQWGVRAVPSSFFIDSHGNIAFIEQGYTSEPGFRLRMWWLKNF